MASEMELVKKLRDELGAGFMACKKALTEANGDYDKAYDILRKQGASKALSKADRVANEGLCGYAKNDSGVDVSSIIKKKKEEKNENKEMPSDGSNEEGK